MAGMRGYNSKRTICEVLREINDLAQDDTKKDAQIRILVAEAFGMGKRMIKKLLEYNRKVDAGWWKANPGYLAKVKVDLRKGLGYKFVAPKGGK